jgi:hypothetical protein
LTEKGGHRRALIRQVPTVGGQGHAVLPYACVLRRGTCLSVRICCLVCGVSWTSCCASVAGAMEVVAAEASSLFPWGPCGPQWWWSEGNSPVASGGGIPHSADSLPTACVPRCVCSGRASRVSLGMPRDGKSLSHCHPHTPIPLCSREEDLSTCQRDTSECSIQL